MNKKKILKVSFASTVLLMASGVFANPPLVKTGIQKCYNAAAELIACPKKGEAFYGQDANYQATSLAKERSYTRDDNNNTVTDNSTGLIWQDNTDVKTTLKNWVEAGTYCTSLTLAYPDGWRLPTIKELQTVIDYSRGGETTNKWISDVFVNTTSDKFWSSSLYVNTTLDAWYVTFDNGNAYSNFKGNDLYVRCVRGGQ